MYDKTDNREVRCPICKGKIPTPKKGKKLPSIFPFCSERCKQIDLGRWLDGSYTIERELNESEKNLFSDKK